MSSNHTALVGATILDGRGGPPIKDGAVLVEGQRIVAIGDSTMALPPEAERIDVAGKYLMPGMMDANVHLFYTVMPDYLMRFEGRYEEVITESAQIALKAGVTTVFDTWGPRAALTSVRDRINQGEATGARIFFAGNIIGFTGPTEHDFFPLARSFYSKARADELDARWEQGVGPDLLYMLPDEVRARIRAYIESGTQDFLKYAGSGHTHEQFLSFSETVQRVIVEEGHRAGMTVQAHTTTPETLRIEMEVGCDLLQHPDITGPVPMPDSLVRMMAERQVPGAALFNTRRYLAWNAQHGSDRNKFTHRTADGNNRRLIEAGAQLLLTTDGGALPADAGEHPMVGSFVSAEDRASELGVGHFLWLKAASELGMKPMDALLAATSNIARAYKVDKDLGTLEPGKYADLLVLDKDPLDHPDNYRAISLVMKEGRIVDRGALPTSDALGARAADTPPAPRQSGEAAPHGLPDRPAEGRFET